jgi:hypothetical protein
VDVTAAGNPAQACDPGNVKDTTGQK